MEQPGSIDLADLIAALRQGVDLSEFIAGGDAPDSKRLVLAYEADEEWRGRNQFRPGS